ncbi:hypothetical protein J6590_081911 [Homalodisca vitripennis]|nr:hypothetical protein J6590_081911 [Homalodisca vitripennis]
MDCIEVKAEETDNVLELLVTTRNILRFNQKVDVLFSVRTANVVGHGLLMFLLCVTSLWTVFGAHKEFDCLEYHSPLFALLLQGNIITELLCLGGKILKISTSVESLSWEINKRMCSEEYPIEHRKKLEVFMLELAHTPTDLTAADLFSVDNSFITSGACHVVRQADSFRQCLPEGVTADNCNYIAIFPPFDVLICLEEPHIDEMDTAGLGDLIEIDQSLENTMSSQSDFFYVTIICIMCTHILAFIISATIIRSLRIFNRLLLQFSSFQAVFMKHMIFKRVKCIQTKAKETDNALELLSVTRNILGFNQKVNDMFLC